MASTNGPDGTGKTGPGSGDRAEISENDLERRRLELEAQLSARHQTAARTRDEQNRGGAAGYGQAVKLSSEFIAGIGVGAALGWVIDRFAGTSPFGLIVFLLLGFGAGVLNVMRSVGVVAEAGIRAPTKGADEDRKE